MSGASKDGQQQHELELIGLKYPHEPGTRWSDVLLAMF